MPNSLIKKASKQTGVTKGKLEKQFKAVEKSARKEGIKGDSVYKVATRAIEKSSGYKPSKKK